MRGQGVRTSMKGQREDTSVRTAMRRRLEGTGVVRGRDVRASVR